MGYKSSDKIIFYGFPESIVTFTVHRFCNFVFLVDSGNIISSVLRIWLRADQRGGFCTAAAMTIVVILLSLWLNQSWFGTVQGLK